MTKKKEIQQNITSEESTLAQQIAEHYHEAAKKLHKVTDQGQVETALAEINTLPEGAQTVLIKTLAKERHTDAANVLLALNEFGLQKGVRKEARRALIQLEGARIYPTWNPPAKPQALMVASVEDDVPYRFWKGSVTDSLAVGEAQLILCFEQVNDPKTVRVFGFLLEFYHDGVKDAYTRVESKRNFEKFMDKMSYSMADVPLKACSLAEGRQLVRDALAINKRFHTSPHRDYRLNETIIQRLVLDATNK